MANIGNILLDKEILLESGTNELEVLVFDVADFTFGINVAKVREVLPAMRITALPRAHPSIRGVFKLRERVIPCVSLTQHLGVQPTRPDSESTMILTDFNLQQTAFLVDEVERIHRLSWENILGVPRLMAISGTPVTAVARCDERLIVMLDFEMIIDRVTESYFNIHDVANPHGLPREELVVLLADDSATVREAVSATLHNSGYTNLCLFENGAEAWNEIQRRFEASGSVEGVADLLISDVEMPQIDGFHLTKRIKEHPQLRQLPVLLYSSIVTPDNHKKGQAVGADAQVAKPDLGKVVELADDLIRAARENSGRKQGEPTRTATDVGASLRAAQADEEPAAKKPCPAPSPATDQTAKQPTVPAVAAVPPPKATPVSTANPSAAEPSREMPPVSPPAGNGQPAAPAAGFSRTTILTQIDPHLWRTFRHELCDRVPVIQEIMAKVHEGTSDDDVLNHAFRVLHTIKSAAMVVPIDEISQATHLVESQLEAVRDRTGHWPLEGLRVYADWLADLASNTGDPQATLSRGREIEKQMAEAAAV